MQTIPLPELANSNAPLWIIMLVAGLVALFGFFGAAVVFSKRIPEILFTSFMVAGWLGAFAVSASVLVQFEGTFNAPERLEAQAKAAQVEIEDSYGLELSPDEILELKWPTEDPTQDFEVFGSAVNQRQIEGAQFEERTIYLVWADGELQLSESEDGKSFSELDPAE